MTRTVHRPRPELALTEGCACRQPRCTLRDACLETALADDRFGIWARGERHQLRLAS